MTSVLPIAALGFFLGMRHATDADHVIAVSTIVSRHRTVGHAALIGVLWGIGHTLTIFIVGGGIIVFGWVIPEKAGLSMEFAVGLLLILLGIMNLRGFTQFLAQLRSTDPHGHGTVHDHHHAHGDYIHHHSHGHAPERHPHDPERTPLNWIDRHLGELGLYQALRPVAIGVVHGLAGSAAVALLVLATIQDPSWALLYLLIFGLGTVIGMMVITSAVALPFTYTRIRAERLNAGLRIASGVISLVFGLLMAWEIGVRRGLFG
ncbi:MAG: sulfite exporter TauE/SafE family protein [Gemmatimonadales bacterium]